MGVNVFKGLGVFCLFLVIWVVLWAAGFAPLKMFASMLIIALMPLFGGAGVHESATAVGCL